MVIAALAELDAERGHAGANIHTFGQAIWWAGVTITTVGYGDYYPVTPVGQAVAFALMIVGISLLGLVTATVAAWFLTKMRAPAARNEEAVMAELRELRKQVAGLARPDARVGARDRGQDVSPLPPRLTAASDSGTNSGAEPRRN
jgi:voltage-gated potassium channel